MSDIKLTDLTPSIFSALLTKLNVKTPKAESRPKEKNQHWRNCYKALQNSLLYMNLFEGVEPDQVIVSHEEGTILNVTSKTDDALISLFSLDYPCVCCHTPVDDDDDRSGNSLRRSVCRLYWHNECGAPDYLIPPELVKALKNAPPNVSIHCPKCMVNNKAVTLVAVSDKLTNLSKKLDDDMEVMKAKPAEKLYSTAVGMPQFADTRAIQLVKALAGKSKPTADEKEEKTMREACTLIIKKPLSRDIRNSEDIRRAIDRAFSDVVIRHARTTPGGSIRLEFQNKDDADKVADSWDNTLFGGNGGLLRPGKTIFPGIIRNIYKDVTEKQIKMSINAVYTNAEIDVFKREEKFTGTVKVLFKSEDELKSAMADPIKIASQRCIVDEYEIRPRVIKCNNCQKFGHIARLCRSKTKCGKCARGHETRSCTITDATKFICAHCDGNHSAGYRGCEILQSKEADLQLRSQYGS